MKLKLLATIALLLFLWTPCYSKDQKSFSQHQLAQVKFNYNVLMMARDSSIYLHSLRLLKNGGSAEVANFMEYQLDEIVCSAWKFMGEMNPSQKKLTMGFLHEIKQHRAQHPRPEDMRVDPTKFSKYFEPFNASYAVRADKILQDLK